ncbi:MAG: 2'-5' RNA ligase family protein [Candidatus Hydrogenedentes bacterium]|nr:2'-5' RNA ligase family protein [Candidatus Hydrogenedentota bacterium]
MSSSGRESPSEYSLEVLLPERVDKQFRRWVKRVPGATWPRWGGHITVLNRFVPTRGLEPIVEEIDRACGACHPFLIRLTEVVSDRHWRDPQLNAVLLVSGSRDEEGYRSLVRLRDSLQAELAPLKRDVQPGISNRPYVPHLSLTRGLPEPEASRLVETARASRLEVKFTVENIWLLEFVAVSPGKERMGRVQSFPLATV